MSVDLVRIHHVAYRWQTQLEGYGATHGAAKVDDGKRGGGRYPLLPHQNV